MSTIVAPQITRLEVDLYIDRLDRHAARLADDLAAARLREVWRSIDSEARLAGTAYELEALEAIGVIEPATIHPEDNQLIERRTAQLAASSASARSPKPSATKRPQSRVLQLAYGDRLRKVAAAWMSRRQSPGGR